VLLRLDESRVPTATRQQLFVRACLGEPPMVEHEDPIRPPHR
jgi:hypothetical protein